MASQWSNINEIMFDLYVAQGGIPVDIAETITADEKPPKRINPNEEDEHKYLNTCSEIVEYKSGPDLGLIKQMLDLVQEMDVSPMPQNNNTDIMKVSKLNPLCNEFVPKTSGSSSCSDSSDNNSKKSKPKRQRNVAIQSIIQAKNSSKEVELNSYEDTKPLKLLKPTDFMSVKNINEDCMDFMGLEAKNSNSANFITSEDKKSDHGDSETKNRNYIDKTNRCILKDPKLMMAPSNMFKRKAPQKSRNDCENEEKKPEPHTLDSFKPSSLTDEYYNMYLERSKLKEAGRDDIWTLAEKKMKEIDTRRAAETEKEEAAASRRAAEEEDAHEEKSETEKKIDLVRLQQHRHLLTEECVVCEVLCVKR